MGLISRLQGLFQLTISRIYIAPKFLVLNPHILGQVIGGMLEADGLTYMYRKCIAWG